MLELLPEVNNQMKFCFVNKMRSSNSYREQEPLLQLFQPLCPSSLSSCAPGDRGANGLCGREITAQITIAPCSAGPNSSEDTVTGQGSRCMFQPKQCHFGEDKAQHGGQHRDMELILSLSVPWALCDVSPAKQLLLEGLNS